MYVGRIVSVGAADKPFVGYRVSSRSFPNRIAAITEDGVAIQPLDPEDMKRNPYIAYNCIRVSKNGTVVSNGSHTDPIFEKLEAGVAPDVALETVLTEMGYEKDEFNTPRIAGIATEKVGYLATVRIDAVEVTAFDLEEGLCRVICTYEMDHVDGKNHPFVADTADDIAKFIVDGGLFREMEQPVCSAAWIDGQLAVFNPHQ